MNQTPAPSTGLSSRLPARAAGLVWLILFVVWFYSFVLPNNKYRDGTVIPRVHIWQILPDLLLENLYPTPGVSAPPSGWRFLPERFDLLAVAAVILAGAWGAGHLSLRLIRVRPQLDSLERTVFAFGLGLSALSLMTMGCGILGLLNRVLFAGVIIALIAGEAWCRFGDRQKRIEVAKPQASESGPWEISMVSCFTVACVAPFVMAMLLGSMLPSTDFDVKEYHLQGPKEYFQQGQVTFLPHNVYTSFPFLTEMLSLLAMVLRNDWFRGALAGKAVLMTFGPLTALGLFAAGRRWFNPTVGWMAALIYLTTPWVYRISIIAYAEGGLSFFLFATLLAVMIQQTSSGATTSLRLTFLAGLLAGSAVACKYPGVLSVAIPLGVAVIVATAFRQRVSASGRTSNIAKTAAVFAAGTLVTFGPWMLKNVVETGNPVYPLLYTVFGGEDWNPEMNEKWRRAHAAPVSLLKEPSRIPDDLVRHTVDVVAKSDWQSPLVFAFAPLAVLWRENRRLSLALWVYILWLFLTWWGLTHRIDRFWLPMLPVVSLLAGVGLAWVLGAAGERRIAVHTRHEQPPDAGRPRILGEWAVVGSTITIVLAAVLFNLGVATSRLGGYNAYLIELDTARRHVTTPSIQLLHDLRLTDKAKVLFVGEAEVFDAHFEHVYNTVFDTSIFQSWTSAELPDVPDAEQPLRPADEIRDRFAEHGITHVFVNWQEIARYRAPGSYGYTDFVTPERFRELVASGVLREVPLPPSPGYRLYAVQ